MRRCIHRYLLALAVMSVSCAALLSRPWYVSTSGSDSNAGTPGSPFKTIEKAVSVVRAGETIFVRGGTYNLTATITLSKSGAENSRISLLAYPGETPLLDFSAQALSGSNRGIVLTGNWWHIKGLVITGAGDNGMLISGGSNNLIEQCSFRRNRDSGLQIDNGASDNFIRNCDSYFNADPPDYGDADGFAPKLTVGSGNRFYGCRAWRNCDDGWDGYLRGANDVTTTIEYCWAFGNGYLEDGTDAGENANGNGFKMGGSDDKTLMHNFILRNCLAFGNKAKGFDQNNNKGSMTLYNCTGHGNLVDNYRISQALETGKILTIKNCAELGGKVSIGAFAVQEKNSWLSPFVVTAADFRSTDPSGATGPRKSDGTLPHIEYMHLAAGSDLIDAGVNLGLPFAGTAPDLGCFETGLTGAGDAPTEGKTIIYPNPATASGYIRFNAPTGGRCEVRLFDATGNRVATLASLYIDAGENTVRLDLSNIRNGVYICELKINSERIFVGRLVRTDTPD
ncbi:MAG: right-handed parallel beta-helix repeat-containing protein [Bacteroidota bacterium]|nr:right-handed parallel beta-helix repeat-containing protein [Bacteroidota bacterium]